MEMLKASEPSPRPNSSKTSIASVEPYTRSIFITNSQGETITYSDLI